MTKKLIAICGPSATGKDTLAHFLYKTLEKKRYSSKILISVTTRPQRKNETPGIDYDFVDNKTFNDLISSDVLLEYTKFNNWYYGTNKYSLCEDKINIGVFNPQGIVSLLKKQKAEDLDIVVIYLKTKLKERLKRSYQREYKIKFEYIRRAIKDYFDFRKFEEWYNRNWTFPLLIIDNIDNVLEKTRITFNFLENDTKYNFLGKKL